MPYTKTIWAEDTPITTALLNKIENGIESAAKDALPLTGGTLTGSIILPNSTKGQIKQTLSDGTITTADVQKLMENIVYSRIMDNHVQFYGTVSDLSAICSSSSSSSS